LIAPEPPFERTYSRLLVDIGWVSRCIWHRKVPFCGMSCQARVGSRCLWKPGGGQARGVAEKPAWLPWVTAMGASSRFWGPSPRDVSADRRLANPLTPGQSSLSSDLKASSHTHQRRIITKLRNNPAAKEIEDLTFGGSAGAEFEIPADLISFRIGTPQAQPCAGQSRGSQPRHRMASGTGRIQRDGPFGYPSLRDARTAA
jgi:hypothetical protein